MDSSTPTTSTVVAVKNGERFLREAIESILAGDLPPTEIIVVDGHSTDGTAGIVSSYPSIRYLLQDGTGIAAAYNQGIAASSGELIAFLSSDDRWDPRKLRLQVQHMEQNPGVDFCVARARHFIEEGMALPPGFRPELLSEDMVAYIMETLLARRRVFDEVGPFNTEFEVAEDVDWFARAKDFGATSSVVDEVLVYKRVHDRNASLNASENNELLLKALRESIKRKRTSGLQKGDGAR